MKQARRPYKNQHRARPAAEHEHDEAERSAGGRAADLQLRNDQEGQNMKNSPEFDAYKDFICKMLDRCDMRMIKIIYEFVFAMGK